MGPGHRSLILALFALAACEDRGSPASPPSSANGAVRAGPGKDAGAEDSVARAERLASEFQAEAASPGTLEGLVLYAGEPPARVRIDTAAEGGCGVDPNEPALTETWIVDGGRLANALVWLENPPPTSAADAPIPPAPETIRQRGCVFRPHVIGLRAGQELAVWNDDRARHNVRAIPRANREFNATQEPGAAPLEVRFAEPEVAIALVCDLHPWMRAWVGVFDHPYFAVTGADGRFVWSALPAGEYRVRAWHEALGRLEGRAVIAAGGGARIALSYPPRK